MNKDDALIAAAKQLTATAKLLMEEFPQHPYWSKVAGDCLVSANTCLDFILKPVIKQ